jgi:hypothetical protein
MDENIRAAISDLRAADARTAPSFDDVLARPRRIRSVQFSARALAIAASVVVAIGMLATFARPHPRHRLVVPAVVIALSSWRSPTESLLDISTSQFYSATQNMDSAFAASRVPTMKLDSTSKGDRQ